MLIEAARLTAPILVEAARWTVKAAPVAAAIVAAAVASSTIVFSEPAIADIMMLAVVVLIPTLGVTRFGIVSSLNAAAWLVIVALGIAGTALSTSFESALTHQLVTLFLAAGAFVIAGYIAADPEPRLQLIMWSYVVACMIATVAALLGYFNAFPGAFELFTSYGRGRGTFKDPNVYGAAVTPALTFAVWMMLREPARRAMIAAFVALPLSLGLLISFSRGAWISAVVSIALLLWISGARARRKTDFRRFRIVTLGGMIGLFLAFGAAIQVDQVRSLVEARANLDQSYDQGPEGRFGGQQKARRLIVENPFGIGTHTFRDIHHREEPHNVYLSQFLNAGWLGGLLYFATVVGTMLVGLRLALRNATLQGGFVVAGSAFAGLAFEGFVIDTDHWRHFFLFMGCIWGLADAAKPVVSPERRHGD